MNLITMDIWDASAWLTAAQLAGIIITAYVALLWIALAVWTWRDVASRTNDPAVRVVAVALVTFFFVPGLLLYIVMRPQDTLAEDYNRRLEAEAFLREVQKSPSCSHCRRVIDPDFASCPYCRATLRMPCEGCGKQLSLSWVACPWCSAERPPLPAIAPEFRRRALTPTAAFARRDGKRPATIQPQV